MAEPASAPPRRAAKRSSWRGIAETVVLTILIFLAIRLAVQNFRVDGNSMLPTLHNGEYILVDRLSYRFHSPSRGDIIVFQAVPALEPGRDFIKRIIGIPGDIIAVHDGGVFVNGHRLREPYISAPPIYVFRARRVPPHDYFVLGDNRNNSYDSSRWVVTPWLDRKYIIGRAWIAYWPLSRFTTFTAPSYAGP